MHYKVTVIAAGTNPPSKRLNRSLLLHRNSSRLGISESVISISIRELFHAAFFSFSLGSLQICQLGVHYCSGQSILWALVHYSELENSRHNFEEFPNVQNLHVREVEMILRYTVVVKKIGPKIVKSALSVLNLAEIVSKK